MSKQMKIRQHSRIVLLIVFTSLLSIAAQAQEAVQDKSEAEAKSPLELKLTNLATGICVGSSVTLELEVTNTGQKDVSLDKVHLWSSFGFSYSAPNRESRNGALGSYSNSVEDRFILRPGTSYKSMYEFALDSDFFRDAGNYTLKTYFDSVYSNEVQFELYDCGKPQEVKEQR